MKLRNSKDFSPKSYYRHKINIVIKMILKDELVFYLDQIHYALYVGLRLYHE